LLLQECGEDAAACAQLIEYLHLNNAALKGSKVLQEWRRNADGTAAAAQAVRGGHAAAGCLAMAAAVALGWVHSRMQ
jgi:hypothetical protein